MGQEGSPGGSGDLYGLICMNCMDCGLPGSSVHGILHGHGNMSPWMCSVAKSCPTLCDPMECSTLGFLVLHHLQEFAQTHVYWVADAIWPFHFLLSERLNMSTETCSLLSMENPMDRGAWQATVRRVTKSWTGLKQLSMYAHKTSSGFGSCYLLSRSTPSSLARNAKGVVCCHRLLNHRNPFVLPSTSELFIFIYFFNITAF